MPFCTNCGTWRRRGPRCYECGVTGVNCCFKCYTNLEVAKKVEDSCKMGDSMHPIGYREIYETLWRTRDFELSTFWQRALLLGSFLMLAYVGYGKLCMYGLENNVATHTRPYFHLLALGISFFGVTMAFLWILMMKGSKACYERTEDALTAFCNAEDSAFVSSDVKDLSGFGMHWTKEAVTPSKESDKNLFSANGGPFSVSRVTILIGQLSAVGWALLLMVHLAFLLPCLQGTAFYKWFISWLCTRVVVTVVIWAFLALLLGGFYRLLCTRVKSSFLQTGDKQ